MSYVDPFVNAIAGTASLLDVRIPAKSFGIRTRCCFPKGTLPLGSDTHRKYGNDAQFFFNIVH